MIANFEETGEICGSAIAASIRLKVKYYADKIVEDIAHHQSSELESFYTHGHYDAIKSVIMAEEKVHGDLLVHLVHVQTEIEGVEKTGIRFNISLRN